MDDPKKTASSRHNWADIHMSLQRLLQHMQDLHRLKPDKISALRRSPGHKVPYLTEKLFAVDT